VTYYEKFASHLRFDSLMAGVGLALISTRAAATPVMPKWLMRFVVLPACVVLIACLPTAVPEYVMLREGLIALWVIGALLVGFAGLDRGYVLSLPVLAPVLEYIGSRSYGLYLIHTTMFRLDEAIAALYPPYRKLAPADVEHPWVQVGMILTATFIAAEILHQAVEKPFMRLGRIVTDRERRAAFVFPRYARWSLGFGAAVVAIILFRHPILGVLGPRDLALHKTVTMSSHLAARPDGDALVNGKLESDYGAHTMLEESPWMTIDLGEPTQIGAIRVYNRADGFQEEQKPLELSVSDDNVNFIPLAKIETVFTQSFPWRIRLKMAPTRYVKFQVPRRTSMCLSEVEIFDGQGMAHLP